MKIVTLGFFLAVTACSKPDRREHYAVGTYLFTGAIRTDSTKCMFDAPPGTLDGDMILAPGIITMKCESGATAEIVAEYADHITPTFDKTVKVGHEIYLQFELRN